ncbi:MAG: TraB/GumN family protein [Simkaniaceae bacterium]|nr:TraB/GumN family protein [Simkaniaceae bacterium]
MSTQGIMMAAPMGSAVYYTTPAIDASGMANPDLLELIDRVDVIYHDAKEMSDSPGVTEILHQIRALITPEEYVRYTKEMQEILNLEGPIEGEIEKVFVQLLMRVWTNFLPHSVNPMEKAIIDDARAKGKEIRNLYSPEETQSMFIDIFTPFARDKAQLDLFLSLFCTKEGAKLFEIFAKTKSEAHELGSHELVSFSLQDMDLDFLIKARPVLESMQEAIQCKTTKEAARVAKVLRTIPKALVILTGGPTQSLLSRVALTPIEPSITPNGFFWEVMKHGQVCGYLYGTCHVATDRMRDFPPPVLAALESSTCLAVEYDITRPEHEGEFELDLFKDGIEPDALEEYLKLASSNRSLEGLDLRLMKIAKSKKIEVIDLESYETHQKAVSEGETSSAIELKTIRMLIAIMEITRTGATKHLELLAQQKAKTDIDCKIPQRNLEMALSFGRAWEEGKKIFAAVGALHTAGPFSIQKYLRDLGFTFSRVTTPHSETPQHRLAREMTSELIHSSVASIIRRKAV